MMMSQELGKYLDFKLMRKILLWFSVAILCSIPIDFMRSIFEGKITRFQPDQRAAFLKKEILVEPLEVYLGAFQQSSLFGSLGDAKKEDVAVSSIAELVKDYRLKGVIISDVPEAIFEDARTQQSSFVHKGEKLGNLDVRDIGEGYVVLGYLKEDVKLEMK